MLASKAPKSSTPFQTKRNEDDNDSESDDDEDDEADGENMDVCDAAENNGTKETKVRHCNYFYSDIVVICTFLRINIDFCFTLIYRNFIAENK